MFMISRVITLTSTYYIPEIVSWQLVPECKHLQRKVQKSLWKENAVCSSNTINTHICIRTTTFKDIKKQFWLAFHWRCLGKLKIVGTAFFRNRLWLPICSKQSFSKWSEHRTEFPVGHQFCHLIRRSHSLTLKPSANGNLHVLHMNEQTDTDTHTHTHTHT